MIKYMQLIEFYVTLNPKQVNRNLNGDRVCNINSKKLDELNNILVSFEKSLWKPINEVPDNGRYLIEWEYLDGSGKGVTIAENLKNNICDGETESGYSLYEQDKRAVQFRKIPMPMESSHEI